MAFGEINSNQVLTRAIHFSGAQFGKGATAPTDVTIGTSPEVPAILFDATAETASVYTSFLPDMDLSQDMTFKVQFSLVNGQINNDQLSLTIDYVVPVVFVIGSGVNKASTQLTPTRNVTTGEGLSANDMYEITSALSAGDATNPITGGAGIAVEIHLTNLTGVAAIHVLDASLEYVALY